MLVKKLAQKNSLNIVEYYANNILIAIDSFDIDNVKSMINNYDAMCEKLKSMEEGK